MARIWAVDQLGPPLGREKAAPTSRSRGARSRPRPAQLGQLLGRDDAAPHADGAEPLGGHVGGGVDGRPALDRDDLLRTGPRVEGEGAGGLARGAAPPAGAGTLGEGELARVGRGRRVRLRRRRTPAARPGAVRPAPRAARRAGGEARVERGQEGMPRASSPAWSGTEPVTSSSASTSGGGGRRPAAATAASRASSWNGFSSTSRAPSRQELGRGAGAAVDAGDHHRRDAARAHQLGQERRRAHVADRQVEHGRMRRAPPSSASSASRPLAAGSTSAAQAGHGAASRAASSGVLREHQQALAGERGGHAPRTVAWARGSSAAPGPARWARLREPVPGRLPSTRCSPSTTSPSSAPNLERCERFYREVLGLPGAAPLAAEGEDGTGASGWPWAGRGRGFLALERAEAAAGAAPLARRPAGAAPGGAPDRARGAGRWEGRLAAAGVEVVHRTRWTIYFHDPEGNRVGLTHFRTNRRPSAEPASPRYRHPYRDRHRLRCRCPSAAAGLARERERNR